MNMEYPAIIEVHDTIYNVLFRRTLENSSCGFYTVIFSIHVNQRSSHKMSGSALVLMKHIDFFISSKSFDTGFKPLERWQMWTCLASYLAVPFGLITSRPHLCACYEHIQLSQHSMRSHHVMHFTDIRLS